VHPPALAYAPGLAALLSPGRVVNDVHSRLNRTVQAGVWEIESPARLQDALRLACRAGLAVSIAGGRHAMGGQQFGDGTLLLDMRRLSRIRALDADRGIVDVEAGIVWSDLVAGLAALQAGQARSWGIAQKQTGADRLSLGGSLAANIHGRGLRMRPLIGDVASFDLMTADGEVHHCSRHENRSLFRLAIGGYGLFGVILAVRLRLVPRTKVERRVALLDAGDLMPAFERQIAEGFTHGDFQFAIDPGSGDFLRRGVFSCYRPVPEATPIPDGQRALGSDDWRRLLALAHRDKGRAFADYAHHYLSTDGQVYWSDTHQLAEYPDDYHAALDREAGAPHRGSEMIGEVYVPRPLLAPFLAGVADDFRRHRVDLIYGTVRLIERDVESYLAWARQPWACVVFNLHVDHTATGVARATTDFRRLIDRAIAHGGSYYLTYHRWARRDQVECCYPQLRAFLVAKRLCDPEERFQSSWYRHYREMLFPGKAGTTPARRLDGRR
jgi:FAD/FMN-containing dehydrogenase